MALTKLEQLIKSVVSGNPDVLIFKSDDQRNAWIKEIEKTFTTSGDEILAIRNRVQVTPKAFEDNIIQLARPFTLNASNAKYLPSIIDKRTKEERLIAVRDTEKVIDFYLEKLGFVFKGEHLGDSSIRSQVKGVISANYMYEGSGPDGEIVLRRSHLGMFGKAVSPVEVIKAVAERFLDERRTYSAQTKITRARRDKALDNLGYLGPDKLTQAQTARLESEISELKEEDLVSYTTKRLPVKDKDSYRTELRLRALHQRGEPDESKLSLHELNWVKAYVDNGLAALDDLPDVRIQPKEIEWQSWPGLADVTNDKGIFLSPERMRASELAGMPPEIQTL